jgi:predicted HAD superfamily phosphohydrolase YqeG
MMLKFNKAKRNLKTLMISIQTPYKLKPHIIAESILDVDFQGLKNLGFQYVVFDKDNTLTDHDVHEITN